MPENASKTRIIQTARRLFFEHGFEGVSTDMLAREASVSKATIYRHFDNLADILTQVMFDDTARFRSAVLPQITTEADLQAAMTDFGRNLLGFLNEPDTVKFVSIVQEEIRRNPTIGRTFYGTGFSPVRDFAAELFARAQEGGVMSAQCDALDLAEDFIALLEGFGMVRARLGLTETPFPDLEDRVARAVRTMLVAHGTVRG